jgi:coniferyl-aldehyde dehydrogenase
MPGGERAIKKDPSMNAPALISPDLAIPAEFLSCFNAQRAAYLAAPEPAYAERLADLRTLARLISENQPAIVAAINADYGNRSEVETLFAEVFLVQGAIHDASKRLKSWMKPRRRSVDLMTFPGARNRVIPQPLGVVGVIVPWNFPLDLSFSPLVSIFAAGNRAMVKMSENSRRLAELLVETAPKYFPETKLAFFDDGGGRGPAFSSLPFDHLLFTGSGATGRAVMANAARNLTPVTLELGGKSPAIVAPGFPIRTAAERILWAKTFNAGQVCITVDYAFLPRGAEEEFVAHCRRLFAERYPDVNSADYTSIIDQRSYDRLQAALEDARAKGATLINLAEGQKPDASQRKFPPHLALNPTDDMELMRREIFGPILPIRVYDQLQETVDFLNARDRPLAIYLFARDAATRDSLISRTMSGGIAVNEPMLHFAQHDMPFGGVGASGMGHYHGREGFDTFSKLRPVSQQGPLSTVQMFFQPPYSRLSRRLMDFMIKLKS